MRATHLKDLYETITMKTLAKDERLDILLTLKATVRVREENHKGYFLFEPSHSSLSSFFISFLLFLLIRNMIAS